MLENDMSFSNIIININAYFKADTISGGGRGIMICFVYMPLYYCKLFQWTCLTLIGKSS